MRKQCDDEGYNDDPNEYLESHDAINDPAWIVVFLIFLVAFSFVIYFAGSTT